MAIDTCIEAVKTASGGSLSDDEARALLQRIDAKRRQLQANGQIDRSDQRLRELAAEEAERARIAAALQRKHAALNAIARDEINQQLESHLRAGFTHRNSVLALLEGRNEGARGERRSVAATVLAYESRYLGTLFGRITKDRPHIERLINDKALMRDVVREMEAKGPLGPGGRVTRNTDAHYLADLFTEISEMVRRDLNGLGANIGRLDGWTPHTHDGFRVQAVDQDDWVDAVLPRLDLQRTFPDVTDEADIREILGEIYTSIVTGRENVPARRGQFVGPANLARQLGRHRVLHFRSSDDFIAYNEQFGFGDAFHSMIGHLRRSAEIAGQMQVLGPNPDNMLRSVLEQMKERARRDLPAAEARRQVESLEFDANAGKIASAWAEIAGLTRVAGSTTGAKWGSFLRATQSWSKLGGAVLSALPTDPVILAQNLRFQGRSFWGAMSDIARETIRGRGGNDFEQRRIAFLFGEGFDGLINHIITPHHAHDDIPGRTARLTSLFFRWNGLAGWTDAMRAVGVRIMAADMGGRAATRFDQLPRQYRHVLELHGITETQWNAIRRTAWTGENGTTYITPERIGDLPDEVLDPLIADRVAEIRAGLKLDEDLAPSMRERREASFERQVERLRDRARMDTELALRRFMSDEVMFGILEADPATRRWLRHGTRPGTVAGELLRSIGQFKGFPIAFTRRVLARQLHAGDKSLSKGERLLQGTAHIGQLIATLSVAGYMALAMKDFARGFLSPREPTKETVIAALLQGGGLGIYGDFIFGSSTRYGNSALETAAGPLLGETSELLNIWYEARDGEPRGIRALNWFVGNTPLANLFYIRPALDLLVLNSLREYLSPGYLGRTEQRRLENYGQEALVPQTVL